MNRNLQESSETCVIASNRRWNSDMAARLETATGVRFVSINSCEDLSIDRLSRLAPRYIFFPHWSDRIPAEIFQQFECIIFHMTDLPLGRGGSPLQNLIASHHTTTQISALRCEEDLDAGPIYLKRPLCLHGSAEEIYIRAAAEIESMILDILSERPEPFPQQGDPTYFKRREASQSNLREARTLDDAFDLIRMLDADGYPRAFLEFGDFRLEFSRAVRRTDRLLADVSITARRPLGTGEEK